MTDREPWIAVKIGAVEHPKVLELANDSARWGLVVLWSKAKRQRPSGVFRSETVTRELLGRHGRYVQAYIDAGFLHVAPVSCSEKRCADAYTALDAPALAVHDWHAYQRDHAMRQLAYRISDAVSDAGSDVSSDVVSDISSRALSIVSSQESLGSSREGSGEGEDPAWLRAWLGVRMRMPTAGQRRVIESFLRAFDVTGDERAARLILATPEDPIGALITDLRSFRAERLEEAEKVEAEATERRAGQRRGLRPGSPEYELAQLLYAKQGDR